MDKKLKSALDRKNVVQLLEHRQVNAEASKFLQAHCQFTDELIKRLGLSSSLKGHRGCVNCLEWSSDGQLLASGSDDTRVIIWDPMKRKHVHVVCTAHLGNIFSVKFLSNDKSIIATAAGDHKVLVQSNDSTNLLYCMCHKGRVKRLANSPLEPAMFWSAGEDGVVVQYDLRTPHKCGDHISDLLIKYKYPYEIKCVALNPTKPHYIAIGANDPFVRVYDRRNIKPCAFSEAGDEHFVYPTKNTLVKSNCVKYYAPGHLAKESASVNHNKNAVTYISFNAAGSEMLVNVGAEQIYLFDANKERFITDISFPPVKPDLELNYTGCQCEHDQLNGYIPGDFQYNKHSSRKLCPCFHMRRGFYLYRRKWGVGDLYCAAREYLEVIRSWPRELKAYIGLIKCLLALNWPEDAQRWYDYLCASVRPSWAHAMLKQQIEEALNKPQEKRPTAIDNEKVESFETDKRLESIDYERRFIGHCNTVTDIKEVNFLGQDGSYICAGSDEGNIFIWERKTQSIVSAFVGDSSIVNCIQPHPISCLIATSGIDSVVKLWSPVTKDKWANVQTVKDLNLTVKANQQRMLIVPYENMFMDMSQSILGNPGESLL